MKQRLQRMSDSIEEELRNLKEKQETIIREINQKKAEVEEMKRMVEEAQQKNIADQIEKFRSEHITYFYMLSLFVPQDVFKNHFLEKIYREGKIFKSSNRSLKIFVDLFQKF